MYIYIYMYTYIYIYMSSSFCRAPPKLERINCKDTKEKGQIIF